LRRRRMPPVPLTRFSEALRKNRDGFRPFLALQRPPRLTPRAHAREGQSQLPPTALRGIDPPQPNDQPPPAGSRGPARVQVPSGADAGPGAGVSPHRGAVGSYRAQGDPDRPLIGGFRCLINWLGVNRRGGSKRAPKGSRRLAPQPRPINPFLSVG
jgi:hypothetical protein